MREKLSLCYYASSIIDVRKGLLLVSSGIQEKNYDAAKDEIFSQLEALQRGEITEEDLETARAGVASDLRSIPDTQSALESFFLAQAVTGADFGPLELAELVTEVNAERVQAVARSVECDQIYLLKAFSQKAETEDASPEASGEEAAEETEAGETA